MQERLKTILDATIREYISSGEPVSSLRLYEDYDLGIKSARIRAILNELTEMGLLVQPHTSGGRIPSDKALELFVNDALQNLEEHSAHRAVKREIVEEFRDGDFEDFVRTVSHELALLGAGYETRRRDFYVSGLDELVRSLDIESRSEFYEIVHDFERLKDRIRRWTEKLEPKEKTGEVQVFIGRKSPITESPHLAVMAGRLVRDGEEIFLVTIGSKRMDYQKNIKFYKAIEDLLN